MTRHPDDELLFDLVDGALDDERAARVRRHLSRCAACSAFVEASSAGATALRDCVEPMPAPLDDRLHAAIRGAWRDRRDAISADERAEDAAAAGLEATVPVAISDAARASDLPETASPRPARRGARRWLPVVAFAMLATLAGTSLYVGNERETPDRATESRSQQPFDGDAGVGEVAGDVPAASSGGAPAASPDANEISAGAPDAASRDAAAGDEAGDPALDVPPVGLDEPGRIDDLQACTATFDEHELLLRDGRLATRVYEAPLGLRILCA